MTYVSVGLVKNLTQGYVTAFFERFLKDNHRFDGYLVENHEPNEVIAKSSDDAR